MGDRANVLVKGGSSQVYLYTHWSGTELPGTVQTALRKHWRWDDNYYLARIIFCQMVAGNEQEETGYGISSVVGDGDDRIVTVDTDTQTISWGNNSMSFAEFVKPGFEPVWSDE